MTGNVYILMSTARSGRAYGANHEQVTYSCCQTLLGVACMTCSHHGSFAGA